MNNNNEDYCSFNYIIDDGSEAYYSKLKKKVKSFNKYFRINYLNTCDTDKLWSKIQRESNEHYNMLLIYKFQLYLPESIWELNKDATTAILK